MLYLDWNTLIVGKLSPWIDADSEIETERRNSEAVSSSFGQFLFVLKKILTPTLNMFSCSQHCFCYVSLQALGQELNFSAYLGLPVFMIPLRGPRNANLARLLLNHVHTGHHTSNVRHTAFEIG